ncbi:hypothetical protein HG264_04315 [Pseudomonas sp. gcc21]|uniref:hypothetical protein n=1 Tax=Pseudomonas sp. gcc21 TaxID=2726989 RepID=UPI0014524C34|nr:hypothetical protein [Pseudomonas sp. gcc21]QJD58194.1 hypothetical protein HG264_04315 [Pseudomonas sp. gcc21]
MPTDMQHQIITDILDRLAAVPDFGALVEEDNVMRIIDADDTSLPDRFIIVQPGITEEIERAGQGSVRERLTLNITPITRTRHAGTALRGARLAIKCALAGVSAGIRISGVQTAAFQPETPMLAGPGQRWSAHVMPLQITYIQPLK